MTTDEIIEAIDAMNAGKAAGPHGSPFYIYKEFKGKLLIPIMEMFQGSYENGSLPPSLIGAMITLLLKLNKPAHKCQSYRPISLLKSDINILCRVLTGGLESILPDTIEFDKNGFVKGRQSFHNVQRVLNILHDRKGCTRCGSATCSCRKGI